MIYNPFSSTLERIEAGRVRSRPDFAQRVEQTLREALTQPFGEPLAVARMHAHSRPLTERVVWTAVVARLEAEPDLAALWLPPNPTAENEWRLPDRRRYRVDLLTNVGPDTAGAMLNDLVASGCAQVICKRDERGPPFLLYHVPLDQCSGELEPLIYEPVVTTLIDHE